MLVDFSLRRYRSISALTLFLLVLLALQFGPSAFTRFFSTQHSLTHPNEALQDTHKVPHDKTPAVTSTSAISGPSHLADDSALLILPDYQQVPEESISCGERYGLRYLRTLGNNHVSYCTPDSASSLTCFRSRTAADGRIDSFCVGGPVSTDDNEKKFKLGCDLRELTGQEVASGVPRLGQLPSYWYGTGPHIVLNKFVKLDAGKASPPSNVDAPRKFTVLVQREEKTTNLWHSLMEIFSLYMSLDVLRMTRDPATGRAYFEDKNIEDTQILILDDHPEGPYYDLWTMFARKPMIRADNLSTFTSLDTENIILPLPGGSNTLWQGDWEVHACEHSELLRTFSQRVRDFYKIDNEPGPGDRSLVLTFIDRKEKRRLIDKGKYIESLKSKYPAIKIDLVDFAEFSFSEQLKIARQTDILVGVHGAGLTHGIFLPPGSTMVEIIPHTLKHKGFRNLAKLLNHHYYSCHTAEQSKGGDWQEDDVSLEEDRFMNLVELAVKSMYNRGLRNEDVT